MAVDWGDSTESSALDLERIRAASVMVLVVGDEVGDSEASALHRTGC